MRRLRPSNPVSSLDVWTPVDATGGVESIITVGTITYKLHMFTTIGTDYLKINDSGSDGLVEYLVVAGGGGGGMDMGGGGGGGGVLSGIYKVSPGENITCTVGAPGQGAPGAGQYRTDGTGPNNSAHQYNVAATNGGNSVFGPYTAIGGGFGGSSYRGYSPGIAGGSGGSGGGASGYNDNAGTFLGGLGTSGQGNRGGNSTVAYRSGGGGGAGGEGFGTVYQANGGPGILNSILGYNLYWAGGGGGAAYSLSNGGDGGIGGGGGGAVGTSYGGAGYNNGENGLGGSPNSWANTRGGNAGANTGGGGGGGSHYNANNNGGEGGSGIIVARYPLNRSIQPAGTDKDGTTSLKAAPSAQFIKTNFPSSADGVYWIDLPTVGPTQIYCLMDSNYDGGGWMMMMKATRGTTFNYSASYWTTNNTLNPTQTNTTDGDAKFDTMNYFAAKDMLARFPDIGSGGSISGRGMWTWLQNNFYRGTRIVPITFWSGNNRFFIQDAKTFSGWGNGVFSSQTDIRFYGYNWTDNMNCRWGFGWNENGGGLYPNGAEGSDDVSGGIGMSYNSFSAGDSISCCQDTTGINRSARVEIFIR